MTTPNLTSSPSANQGGIPGLNSGANDLNERHFKTDHLLSNLKGRAVSSGFVTGIAQAALFVLNLGSVMVLARLLTPRDFGLVAMVLTITGFLRIFNDAGLSTATVQREGITHAQVSNLFWANVALGGAITLLMALMAPVIAWFYREPRLVGVTLALCVTFLLTSSAVQHLAVLKRQMRFKEIAVIQVSSTTIGVIVGVGMAWFKCGYWSLVAMQLCTPVFTFFLTWRASRWRPQRPTRRSGTRSLLRFGANLTAGSFLWSLARGSDALLIGRVYGSAPLGLYSRAAALMSRPVEQFLAPLDAVFVPTLSRLQSQPDRYRRVFLQVFDVIAIACFPFSGLFFALSHPLTLVVLGPKWANAAPMVGGFSLVALYTPMAGVTGWLLNSQGRGKDLLRQCIIGSISAVVSFLIGLPFGPVGVATSFCASCILLGFPIQYYIAGRQGPVSTGDLWKRLLRHLPLWVVVCTATWLTRQSVLLFAPWKQLAVCAPIGLLAGAAFMWFYPPARRAVLNLLQVLREFNS